MKLSSNSVGMLIFLAIGIAVFVLMAMRPAVEGSAMNFGIPLNSEMPAVSVEATKVDATTTEVEEKQEDTQTTEAAADESTTEAKEEAPVENTDSTEEKDTTTN